MSDEAGSRPNGEEITRNPPSFPLCASSGSIFFWETEVCSRGFSIPHRLPRDAFFFSLSTRSIRGVVAWMTECRMHEFFASHDVIIRLNSNGRVGERDLYRNCMCSTVKHENVRVLLDRMLMGTSRTGLLIKIEYSILEYCNYIIIYIIFTYI